MPRGTYDRIDLGATEAFTQAPGPAGWRYASSAGSLRVDVSVNASGEPVRARMESTHDVMVVVRGSSVYAVVDGEATELEHPPGIAVIGPSPGLLGALLEGSSGDTMLDALRLDPDAGTIEPCEVRCERVDGGPMTTSVGIFDAIGWSVDGVAVHTAGAIAVEVAGMATLIGYEPGASGPWPRLRGE